MPLVTSFDNKMLDALFSATALAGVPATLYCGLSTTTPTKAGGNVTEPAGSAYARVGVTNNAGNFPAAAAGSKSNGAAITFPVPSGSWGTVTYFVLYDAAVAGNLVAYGALNAAKTIGSGADVSFPIGALVITQT